MQKFKVLIFDKNLKIKNFLKFFTFFYIVNVKGSFTFH